MATNPRTKPTITVDAVAEKFAEKMRALDLAAKEREVERRSGTLGLSAINLKGFPIGPETLGTIPRSQAEELRVVCFFNTGGELRIGAIDPTLPQVRELVWQLGERFHANAKLYGISEESFRHARKLYDAIPDIKPVETGVRISEADLTRFQAELTDLRLLTAKIANATVSEIVTLLIAGAIQAKSSDIHVEAEETSIAVRYRIDGILQPIATIPKELWGRIVSRMKLLSGLKLNVADVPQDGRFTITLTKDKIDVRVSTLPTAWGESVVMRLLMSSVAGLQFEQLGLRGRAHEQLKREVERPNGMIVTTGPTGSGKTTTLYAILNKLNEPGTKIITLEDPVEYKMNGISQSQIDASKDYTFAKGLRSILRQDPDVVMVGEIRDLETAEVAIQAALTGHLMLSTIHTNSAAGAIPRFLSMGVKAFLLAPALNAIIGQRLVRRVHADCAVEDALAPDVLVRVQEVIASLPDDEWLAIETQFQGTLQHDEMRSAGARSGESRSGTTAASTAAKREPEGAAGREAAEATPQQRGASAAGARSQAVPTDRVLRVPLQFKKGGGCDGCHGTGYKGRVGVYEVMIMNKDIEAVILSEKVSEYQMQELAVKQGMVTMVQDGILKALDGLTTVDEVFRVAE